ncbi:MAG: cytochrome C oxidase subunit IV family protein [Longimicrobiales bacterium]
MTETESKAASAEEGTGAGHATPNYIGIWVVLGVLTLVEVGVAFIGLPKTMTVIALVLLAVWKAVLVAMYYMHLRFEPRKLVILALSPLPLAFILVLAVLTEF